jgi:hypothetical protein
MPRLIALLVPAFLLCGCKAFAPMTSFSDDFTSYHGGRCAADGERIGPWSVVNNGYGCVSVEGDGHARGLQMSPREAGLPRATHAVLVTGPRFKAPMSYSVQVNTLEQLREAGPAHDWETAWVVWGYSDQNHFYYFIPKPVGWELGKRDPAYPGGQRFLASEASPVFPLGSWTNVTITQDADNTITVFAAGRLITNVTDAERPYTAGKIGFYGEDSLVLFKNVSAASKPGPSK